MATMGRDDGRNSSGPVNGAIGVVRFDVVGDASGPPSERSARRLCGLACRYRQQRDSAPAALFTDPLAQVSEW